MTLDDVVALAFGLERKGHPMNSLESVKAYLKSLRGLDEVARTAGIYLDRGPGEDGF